MNVRRSKAILLFLLIKYEMYLCLLGSVTLQRILEDRESSKAGQLCVELLSYKDTLSKNKNPQNRYIHTHTKNIIIQFSLILELLRDGRSGPLPSIHRALSTSTSVHGLLGDACWVTASAQRLVFGSYGSWCWSIPHIQALIFQPPF